MENCLYLKTLRQTVLKVIYFLQRLYGARGSAEVRQRQDVCVWILQSSCLQPFDCTLETDARWWNRGSFACRELRQAKIRNLQGCACLLTCAAPLTRTQIAECTAKYIHVFYKGQPLVICSSYSLAVYFLEMGKCFHASDLRLSGAYAISQPSVLPHLCRTTTRSVLSGWNAKSDGRMWADGTELSFALHKIKTLFPFSMTPWHWLPLHPWWAL